ncbi:MAG: hypothetical protein ACREBV_03745 [Candidatus Zixiibacteriota bacterium]
MEPPMDTITIKEIKSLIDSRNGVCLSIYVPTFISGKEVEQNQIRYKNLLRNAEEQLKANGYRPNEIEELIEPLKKYVDDSLFWKYQSHGLAVFRSKNHFYSYRLPLEFKELSVVSRRFHIKPLLPFFNREGQFYLLAFSKGKIRLFRGSKYSTSEVELSDIPKSLQEALKFDVYSKELQFQTGAPRHGNRRDAIFFGGGSNEPKEKNEILRFLQQVDKGINEYLKKSQAPLVLAGVDYLIPIYEEANKYPHLINKHISGNPDDLTPEKLHEKAWELVAPKFYEDQGKAQDRFKQLHGSSSRLASLEINEIILAAYDKRIETLFVANDVQVWGSFDSRSLETAIHDSPADGNEDLLDFASAHTLINGGTVYPMPQKKVPRQRPAAAIFRF